MKTLLTTSLLSIGVLAAAAAAEIPTFIETFDGGPVNDGQWRLFGPESYPMTGGNPGRYLRTTNLDTWAPWLTTTAPSSTFYGNWREAGVIGFGVDINIFAVSITSAGRPATLMLVHDNGTPGDYSDDTAAVFRGPDIPAPGTGWAAYDYAIESQSETLPDGWQLINLGDIGAPPNHTWSEIITNVSRVEVLFGDPEFFYIFQQWTVGIDNTRLAYDIAETAPEDLNGDGVVDLADLLILLAAWGTCDGECPADLDGDGSVGLSDLLQLLAAWS